MTNPDREWKPARPLARGNAVEQILEDLRDRILSGQLVRGTRLPSEKQLAEAYGVSGATIREALRGLIASELVEVRHGSGAYVTAQSERLLDAALRAFIQLERVGVADVLQVLGGLNVLAARLAAEQATEEQLARLESARARLDAMPDGEDVSAALAEFLDGLAGASGNPLLQALCGFLSGLQIALARERSGGTLDRQVSAQLSGERQRVVQAVAARSAGDALRAASAYQERSTEVLLRLPASAG